MGRERLPTPARGSKNGTRHAGAAARAVDPRKGGRPTQGARLIVRNGQYHIKGTERVRGRSKRLRQSTELSATPENFADATEILRQAVQEARDELLFGVHSSVSLAVAIDGYLARPRKRPLNPIDVMRLKEIERKFGASMVGEITNKQWCEFVDHRMAKCAPVTRERYIDTVTTLLKWCAAKPRCWVTELPIFERDPTARRQQRRARRVGELRPDLIALLISQAGAHLKGPLAIMWTTGGRVSSVLHGCRLCDYLAAEGREQITYHDTKNGDRVTAAVHPWAAAVMRDYLAWRGHLEDREAPLFLTHRWLPYIDNERASGGQMKNAWRGMKARSCAVLQQTAATRAEALRLAGDAAGATAVIDAAQSDIELLGQLTPHWFRHLLATTLLATGDLRSTMEQGGWRDARSVMGYSHDVPERRRSLVGALPSLSGAGIGTLTASGTGYHKNNH